MAAVKIHCFSCGEALEFVDRVGFREECTKCGEDCHACKNCEFYDATAYNECREPSADVVREKSRANFCEYFQANNSSTVDGRGASKDDLLSAAEALFKKK